MPGYEVQFDWKSPRTCGASCPMCGSTGPHGLGVNVHSRPGPAPSADFWRCRTCGGLFAHPFAPPDYSEDYGFPDYLRFYAEAGAGVASMITPVLRAYRRGMRTMVDVGSGVPFAADFARRMLKLDARSIDPSGYAKTGGEWLGVPVETALLGGGSSADGERFDLVYSSEVVEHVEDPAGFLALLVEHLAPEGVLVVTTPNAGFVSPERAPLENLGLVWPGIHRALYMPGGLEAGLNRAGLPHVEVSAERERLVAYASRQTLALNREEGGLITAWLEGSAESPVAALKLGHLFRLFRDAVGAGRVDDALTWLARLRIAALDASGRDITHAHEIAADAEALEAADFHRGWPYFAPLMPYLLGTLHMAEGRRDLEAAARDFAAQVRICERFHGGDPLWRAEIAHLWAPALFSYGLARLMRREADDAITAFEKLMAGDAPAGSLAAMGRRDKAVLVQARVQLGSALIQAGRKDEARTVLTAAREGADTNLGAAIDRLLERCG